MEIEKAYRLLHPDTHNVVDPRANYAGFYGEGDPTKTIMDACNVACDAMDTRIPKRLKNLRRHIDHDSGLCPVCGTRNTTYGEVNYCFSCGQALDWSSSNEE